MDGGMIVFIVLIVAGVVAYSFYIKQKHQDAWKAAAHQLGLEFDEGGLVSNMKIYGTYRGKPVEIRHEKERRRRRRRGKTSRRTVHFAAIEATLEAPCWQGVSVSPHGLMDSVTTFFGAEDREVGDKGFDSDFRIKGTLDDTARSCLSNAGVQTAIRGLSRAYGSFELDRGRVCIREKGRYTNASALVRMVDRVVDTAEQLDESAGIGSKPQDDEDDEIFPDFETRQSKQAGGDEVAADADWW